MISPPKFYPPTVFILADFLYKASNLLSQSFVYYMLSRVDNIILSNLDVINQYKILI